MRSAFTLAIFVLAGVPGDAADKPPDRGEMPVIVEVKSRDVGKGHFCTIDLRLKNRNAFPVWFVFAAYGNELLRHDGKFSAEYEPDPFLEHKVPFEAEAYDEGKGSAVIVSLYGKDGFRAILLPANGQFHFGGFDVDDFSEPPRFIDVWEVKTLKVNGTTPLEQWLPFRVSSSKSVEIAGRTGSGNQKVQGYISGRDAKPYPNEKVKTIVAEPLRRFVIPLPE